MESTFTKSEANPLTELAELRLALAAAGEQCDVRCQLRFSTAEIDLSDRQFLVGIREARLQLYLEGCETMMGKDFGDAGLPTYEEITETTTKSGAGGRVSFEAGSSTTIHASATAQAGVDQGHTQTVRSTTSYLPVTALPNSAWRIRRGGSKQTPPEPMAGTAMRGEVLCSLERKTGFNRLVLNAELQVKRSDVSVEPTSGNKLGKRFSLVRNKDAVVAKVLERALRREASAATGRGLADTVVVSKCGFEEQ